jgi:hypothetical protein
MCGILQKSAGKKQLEITKVIIDFNKNKTLNVSALIVIRQGLEPRTVSLEG